MHLDFYSQIEEIIGNGQKDYIGWAAPRGNAKSTIVSFALILWCALYAKKRYILLVSDTTEQATDFLGNIRSELESNYLLINDFGDMTGFVWNVANVILNNEVRIQALGAGKRVRGRRYKQYRPDLVVVDDLENDENVISPDQRKKMRDWFYKALSKVGDSNTDIIVIGTLIHYDSLLAGLMKNPIYKTKKYKSVISFSTSNLWDEWELLLTNLEDSNHIDTARGFFEDHKAEMLEGTKVLWPEKEDYYDLMVQRVGEGEASFASEKQNEPLSDEERRFLSEWIRYYDDDEIAGKDLFVIGYVDPSMGKKGGDYSAIITLGMDSNGIMYVLEADLQRRHPDLIVDDVLSHHQKYAYRGFGVEKVQFQEFFKDTMSRRMEEMGVSLPIKGVGQISDKMLRIQSLQPLIKNGTIRFKKGQTLLLEQLINFPSASHDDGPDALEGAVSMLRRKSGFAEFYKNIAHEHSQQSTGSLIQQFGIQGVIR